MQVSSNLAAGGLRGAEGFSSHLDSHETFLYSSNYTIRNVFRHARGLENPSAPLNPSALNKGGTKESL